jgi:hypothetical protein
LTAFFPLLKKDKEYKRNCVTNKIPISSLSFKEDKDRMRRILWILFFSLFVVACQPREKKITLKPKLITPPVKEEIYGTPYGGNTEPMINGKLPKEKTSVAPVPGTEPSSSKNSPETIGRAIEDPETGLLSPSPEVSSSSGK